jgi:alanine-glyoxylate transaminase/(R)-3-amino-2-methylpropionate-pyruvate transaminase
MKGKLHFSTFGGNPCPTTQALASLEIIERDGLVARCEELGQYLMDGLRELQARHPVVGDVRGKGLLIGVELVKDRKTKAYGTEEMAQVMEYTKAHGLLIGKGGMYGNVIRLTPPMCITRDDCDTILRVLGGAFEAVEKS